MNNLVGFEVYVTVYVYVCVCVCVCEFVFAGKRGPCSDILYSDRGRPRIGEIVLMVANSTCIHMRMC